MTFGYNARSQLQSLVNADGASFSFSYDNGGRLSRITRPGSYIDYQYNARNWLTAVLNRTTGGATRYDASYFYNDGTLWDHTGNPLKRVETSAAGTYTTTLRYDNVYRLTEETLRDSGGAVQYTHTYTYDAVGNRILRNDGGALSLGHGYDANDKLTITRWVGGGPPGPITANFYYDGAGNITSVTGTEFGAWTMTYDDESRLKTVTPPAGGTETFTYNALGQRMKLSVNYVVTRYVYDGDRVLEETNDAGTVQARYTTAARSYYAPLLHMWRPSESLSRFPMYDLTGSVRGLVDAAGAVTDTYSLELFGKQRASTGSTVNPYRFGGAWGYINGVSGLQQLGHRFYWPELGRFIQQDPIGDGMNWYAYVGNNPISRVDPFGLEDTTSMWRNLVEPESAQQLWMSAKATASGVITGATGGLLHPDWRDPCDEYGTFSRNMGIGSGVLLSVVATNPQAARGSFRPFWRYVDKAESAAIEAGGRAGNWMVRGRVAPYAVGDAEKALSIGHEVSGVAPIRVPWWKPVAGPRPVAGGAEGALEWYRALRFP